MLTFINVLESPPDWLLNHSRCYCLGKDLFTFHLICIFRNFRSIYLYLLEQVCLEMAGLDHSRTGKCSQIEWNGLHGIGGEKKTDHNDGRLSKVVPLYAAIHLLSSSNSAIVLSGWVGCCYMLYGSQLGSIFCLGKSSNFLFAHFTYMMLALTTERFGLEITLGAFRH